MVWGHSVLQIGATLAWAAYMAIGNAGIWIVVGVFGILALNQKDKIALWMEGRLR
jgi:hypothetical protein